MATLASHLEAQEGSFALDPAADHFTAPLHNPVNDLIAQPSIADAQPAPHRHRIRTSKEKLRVKLYVQLLLLDLASILLGFAIADFARFGNVQEGPGLSLALGSIPVFIPLAFSARAYSIEALSAPRQGMLRALKSFLTAAAALVLALFYAKTAGDVSRLVFAGGVGLASILIVAARYGFGQVVGRKHGWVFVNEVLLVDGVTVFPAAGQIVVFADQCGLSPTSNDPAAFERLGLLLANCDRVMLASAPERRNAWANVLKCAGISVEVLAPELNGLGALQLRHADGVSALLVSVGPLGLRDRMIKRTVDLAVAVPALIIAAPVMLLVALAIKMTSRGPVFFSQPRVGQANRIFDVRKFRTMYADLTDRHGARSAHREDDRVTPLGRFLRKTSLDELPQFFNVVKGDMSLVGPRPHALGSTAGERLFWDADSRYWQRGAVKPGITGLAQVRGFRGATHNEEDLVNRVQADLEYLAGWNIWRDLRILFQTAKVLVHPNAF